MSERVRFRTQVLRRAKGVDDWSLLRAGLEWDLDEPIVIENRGDLKSEASWHSLIKPFHHQVSNLITFCRRLPVTLLADDVGLGKTISAGLIISELQSRQRLSKTLIVCPKLLGPQWQEELASKFGIAAEVVSGQELLRTDPEDGGAVITTYNSARLYLERIPQDRFQMLVLDEAHKLRNLYGVQSPPKVAKVFRRALEERRFRYVLMLTATPIHNRLWDIYSLIDLLTVARGHQNPFGGEGLFARKFIADNKDQARQLRQDAKDEFRSIVYSYMSRVRRGDAKLYFPDRIIQMHRVEPTQGELDLIGVVAKSIQSLNRLVQISILQALVSSPDALSAQLRNMARNGTVQKSFSDAVEAIAKTMPLTAKLRGLGDLIQKLMEARPRDWRVVVFTTRVETQTTILAFLEGLGAKVGVINGMTTAKNQETIAKFKKSDPEINVIVSTEAGSEGVNLQAANVLVNFDLPWNPMIVEQRIGRIQRLASEHAHVNVFNVTLSGTFEDYIVGRLHEKLQMASHAIGDIDALLEASGMGEDGKSFDERILDLVLAALQGKDVELATKQTEKSIEDAKVTLEEEKNNIEILLGSSDESRSNGGPRPPEFPALVRSMDVERFALAAFRNLGAAVSPAESGQWLVEDDGEVGTITFSEPAIRGVTLFKAGSPAFQRLVDRAIASGLHQISESNVNPKEASVVMGRQWLGKFGGEERGISIACNTATFEGEALLRVRATVAHDSYERLVEARCDPSVHRVEQKGAEFRKVPPVLENPRSVGVLQEELEEAAIHDEGVAEFRRFYLERRDIEIEAARGDERKQKKLEDDFTPRLDVQLVGLSGRLSHEAVLRISFGVEHGSSYVQEISVRPDESLILSEPLFGRCASSGREVPAACLERCEVSDQVVLSTRLRVSELSGRRALDIHTLRCQESGKLILSDEAEESAISGNLVFKEFLKTSAISGKRAEAIHFKICSFTQTAGLSSEIAQSEISGRPYRVDQQGKSAESGRTGHVSEFFPCSETGVWLAPGEGQRCEVSGSLVRSGILEQCSSSGKSVLPQLLEQCCVTGDKALRSNLVASSIGGGLMLPGAGVASTKGKFCTPAEAKPCDWSEKRAHPDDLCRCGLTGLNVHIDHTTGWPAELKTLRDMLDGLRRGNAAQTTWGDIEMALQKVTGNKAQVKSAIWADNHSRIAVLAESKSLFGLRTNVIGAIYCLKSRDVIGRVAVGRRENDSWHRTPPR